jgi:hypothetical protein
MQNAECGIKNPQYTWVIRVPGNQDAEYQGTRTSGKVKMKLFLTLIH